MSNQPLILIQSCGLLLFSAVFGSQMCFAQTASMPSSAATQPTMASAPAEYSWEQELAIHNARIDELLPKWRAESDPMKKRELESELFQHLVYTEERSGDIEDIQAGGDAASKRIALPQQARTVMLEPLLTFPSLKAADIQNIDEPSVVRRINKDHFELWIARHGWLFSADGTVLNEAVPPRKGTVSHWWRRGWFGAFLPDGRWITTEIEEFDRTLTCFNRAGKYLWERKADALITSDKSTWGGDAGLISWARPDAEGKGWVVHVSHGGEIWIGPNGKSRVLKEGEAWQLTWPRQLGVRQRAVPDDHVQTRLVCEQAGHGKWVPFPFFKVEPMGLGTPEADFNSGPGKIIHNAVNTDFGFWPGSSNTYINDNSQQSWFFDQQWNCLGIVNGQRIADAADGKGMLFLAGDTVATLDSDIQPVEARKFADAKGGPATIVSLYDDTNCGLFIINDEVAYCRWVK